MPKLGPVINYRLTNHAQTEMVRRQISGEDVARVLAEPEQIEMVRPGRAVYQSRLEMGNPAGMYLLRIFVDYEHERPNIVTVYRTSKIGKYWRKDL